MRQKPAPQCAIPLGGPFVVVDVLGYELSRHEEIDDAGFAMRTGHRETGALAVVRAIDAKPMAYIAPFHLGIQQAERRAVRAAFAWRRTVFARATAEGTT